MTRIITLTGSLVVLLFACNLTPAKSDYPYFEGKISYEYDFIIRDTTRKTQFFKTLYPTKSVLTFKDGNSIEEYEGGESIYDLYIVNQNKLYTRRNQSDTLYWFDCGNPGEEILSMKVHSNNENILGIKCDELSITYKNKTVTYWYNQDTLKINPDWFKRLTYTNRNITSKKLGAVCLKVKVEYPDYILMQTVNSISTEKINSNIFTVPANAVLVKD
jgi:hypothetical protein